MEVKTKLLEYLFNYNQYNHIFCWLQVETSLLSDLQADIFPGVLCNAVTNHMSSSALGCRKDESLRRVTRYAILSCIPQIDSGPDVEFKPFSGNTLQGTHTVSASRVNHLTLYVV